MFVFIYFLIVTIITAVTPGFLYHPCDPYMANKAGYTYLIASALGHLLLLEAGRLTGLLKKRRLVLEIFMLVGVIFASLLFIDRHMSRRCCDINSIHADLGGIFIHL